MQWPASRFEARPWRQSVRGGTAADRKLAEIAVCIPPLIAHLPISFTPAAVTAMESATHEISKLHAVGESHLRGLGALLLRSESVASSKIENVEASLEDFGRAFHGLKANSSATSMVQAMHSISELMQSVETSGEITLEMLLKTHARLMANDPSERSYAGKFRDMQNWVGGSDHSPRNALLIPAPPQLLPELLEDLIAFANRDDVPALAQAAIAHAQFETIHPFTDGNGRVGRALINAILMRRRASGLLTPIATALVARRDEYFALLNGYRAGELEPLVIAISRAAEVAAKEACITAHTFADLEPRWREILGNPRSHSALTGMLPHFLETPYVTAEGALAWTPTAASRVYSAIERCEAAGILRPLTNRQRGQIWGVVDVLDELEDLASRVSQALR